MSFQNLGSTISTSFQAAKSAAGNPDNSTGFFSTFKDNFIANTRIHKGYTLNNANEIVTEKNIDSYIPKMDETNAQSKLVEINKFQDQMNQGKNTSWDDYFSSLGKGEEYITDLIQNTTDLSQLTSNDLVEANKKARASVLSQNEALKAQTVSAKASKVAMSALSGLGNMAIDYLVSKGVEAAATAIDHLMHYEERLTEAAEAANENIQSSYSSYSDTKKSTSNISEEFAELSQHVNQNTGKNKDLSTEEYNRYLELSNQLADSFPENGYIIDENQNKIVNITGSAEEIIKKINDLNRKNQSQTHKDVDKEMKDVFEKKLLDLQKDTKKLHKSESTMTDVKEGTKRLLDGESLLFDTNNVDNQGIYTELEKAFRDANIELNYEFGHMFLNYTAESAELSDDEIADIERAADDISKKYNIVNDVSDGNIAETEKKIQDSLNTLSVPINSWLTTDFNYSSLVQSYGNELGSAIQSSINSINWGEMEDVNSWKDAKTWINDNILTPLKNVDNEEIRQAYTELFTNDNLSMDSAMEYLSKTEKYYNSNDLTLPESFKSRKEELTDLQNRFNEKNNSFKSGDINGLNQFFQDNSIDDAGEIEKWLSVTEGITDATTAMAEWKRLSKQEQETPESFENVWDSIGTTGSDSTKKSALEAKNQLLQLAEAGKLTAEELEKSPAGQTLLEQTKLSAEEAAEKVNNLADASKQLSSLREGIAPISNVLTQKQENLSHEDTAKKGISADSLSGFDAEIKGLKSWKDFEQTMRNGRSSMKACQKEANKLATEWINSNNFLSQLNDTNEEYYVSQLKEMGIDNAQSIVKQALNQQVSQENKEKINLALSTIDLTDGIQNGEVSALFQETEWLRNASFSTKQYYLQKLIANKNALSTAESTKNLIRLSKQAGLTGEAIKELNRLSKMQTHYETMKTNGASEEELNAYSNKINKQKGKVKKAANKKITANIKLSDPQTSKNGNAGTSGGSSLPKQKETKQSFDWLDRYITVLTKRVDLLKAKLENLFSVEAKNKNLSKQIKAINKEIKTYSKQAKIYSKKAKSIKFSDKNIINKIAKGKIKKDNYGQYVKEYGEKDAKKIQKYMDLKDKTATAKQNWEQAVKTKRDLKIQKHQNRADYYDSIGSQYDAQIENASTAKKRNELEEKKLSYIKKSYNHQIKIARLEENSVKAATLLAKKWKEIADIRKQILQNKLDENADKLNYNNAAYENADNAGKKKLINDNISIYQNNIQSYQDNVTSAQNEVNSAKSDVSKKANAVTKQMKKDGLNKSTMKEIQSYLSKGEKVPEAHLSGTKVMLPSLYKKLVAYNASIDAANLANDALTNAQKEQNLAVQENITKEREDRSKIIQIDIDSSNNQLDRLSADYANLTTADAKNKNIDEQLKQQEEKHKLTRDQINNDIIDPAERSVALAKEEANWITTQREQGILKLQNFADEESAQYALKQQQEANADSAAEKNKFEAESLEHLKAQYDYNILIADKNGNEAEMKRLQLEKEQKIEESYQRQIDNLKEEYSLILDMNKAKKATIDSKIAALQANGYGISTDLYKEQQRLDQENYSKTLEEINKVTLAMENLSGDALAKAKIELESLKQEAWEYQKAWAEVQKTINEINLAKIARTGTMLKYQADNLDYMQDILSHSDFTVSDTDAGGLTMEGLASASLTFAKIGNNKKQIANLYEQIAEKNRQLEAGEYVDGGDQLTAELHELLQQANELEKANYDLGESIKSMVIDSLNSLSSTLDENISKYKEALQAQKDLYDYRKKIADQLKSVASLEKQLAALQGSDTEEARARIQKLQIQLENEQQNLKDMEYEKYIQDQEEILDKISNDFQDFIANVSKQSVSDICKAMSNAVSDNMDDINNSIADAFAKSTKIGEVASSIQGLTEMIDKLNFTGKISTKTDANGNITLEFIDDEGNKIKIQVNSDGTITGYSKNDQEHSYQNKNHSKSDSSNPTQTNSSQPRQKIAGEIYEKEKLKNWFQEYVTCQLDDYIAGGSSRISYDYLNQYLWDNYGKMATTEQENQILNKLGISGNSNDLEALRLAAEKLGCLELSNRDIVDEFKKNASTNLKKLWLTQKLKEHTLTPAQIDPFQEHAKNLISLNVITRQIKNLSNISEPVSHIPASNTVIRNFEIHLDGSNILDANSFIHTLHNPRVLQEISNGISSQLGDAMSNWFRNF